MLTWEITAGVFSCWFDDNADASEDDESAVVPEDTVSEDDECAVVLEGEQSWDKWKCDDDYLSKSDLWVRISLSGVTGVVELDCLSEKVAWSFNSEIMRFSPVIVPSSSVTLAFNREVSSEESSACFSLYLTSFSFWLCSLNSVKEQKDLEEQIPSIGETSADNAL